MDGTAGHDGEPASPNSAAPAATDASPPARGLKAFLKLARIHQWGKGAFVLVGPAYGAAAGQAIDWLAVALAFLAFGLASSGCYVFNDIQDVESDRHHPRKRRRPIASGAVSIGVARSFAVALMAASAATLAILALIAPASASTWTASCVVCYVVNVMLYTHVLKHHIIADVLSLALGFVLRVLGGCAAAGIEPSTWLLNVTLFVSMFLAFAKRLGERRTMDPGQAHMARGVQQAYTDDLLRMSVVVTGVATLLTYAGYVQAQADLYTHGFNLLWLTMLPATYGLLRCIVLVERGDYDDPTELATRDRAFQLAGAAFVLLTAIVVIYWRSPT